MTGDGIVERIAALPREPLAAWPTPLDPAPRLGAELGIELSIKRDDLTGIGLGGNKLRKLEYIVGEARRAGIDTLLTTGGRQSNHARLTAAVAVRAGLACELHLRGTAPAAATGNLLLDALFGASVTFCGDVTYGEVDARMAERAEALARAGRKALVVPLGGATALGTVGYVRAFHEILDQAADADRPLTVAVSGGTGSTAAGLALGAALWAPGTQLLVVSASWTEPVLRAEIARHVADAAALLGTEATLLSGLAVDDTQVGPGYAQPSESGSEAVRRLATREGVVLDATYTGKALAGLIGRCRQGAVARGSRVVFVHTGGTPEIFTRSPDDLGLDDPTRAART